MFNLLYMYYTYNKMFGAMYFVYYINRSIAMEVDSTFWAFDQQLTAYMSCGESWAQTCDV